MQHKVRSADFLFYFRAEFWRGCTLSVRERELGSYGCGAMSCGSVSYGSESYGATGSERLLSLGRFRTDLLIHFRTSSAAMAHARHTGGSVLVQ
eukprot:3021597-Rhodomonas_salina.1